MRAETHHQFPSSICTILVFRKSSKTINKLWPQRWYFYTYRVPQTSFSFHLHCFGYCVCDSMCALVFLPAKVYSKLTLTKCNIGQCILHHFMFYSHWFVCRCGLQQSYCKNLVLNFWQSEFWSQSSQTTVDVSHCTIKDLHFGSMI